MKPAILLPLLAATIATAQPIDVKDELWYPTNPPRKVSPDTQAPAPAQKASADTSANITSQGSGNITRSPEDIFLAAYQEVTKAQKSITAKDYDEARKDLTRAITGLDELGKLYPQWQPQIVKFRTESTQKLLASLPSK